MLCYGDGAHRRAACPRRVPKVAYALDEFTFRFNRRRTPMAAFQTLLGLGAQRAPTTYRQLYDVESTG